jgi:hypothetical protein
MPEPVDLSIQNRDILWRRIHPGWIEWAGENEGITRPTSVAFQDRITAEVSVSVARETTKYRILRCYPEHSLAAITVEAVRGVGCVVTRRPTADDPAHAVILPSPTKSRARDLAKQATWVVLLDRRRLCGRLVIRVRAVWRMLTVAAGFQCPRRN